MPATEAVVRYAGWSDVATVVEEQAVVFADAEAWWRWSWSHVQRRAWESVDDFAALHRELTVELAVLADSSGRLTYRPRAAFTLATR